MNCTRCNHSDCKEDIHYCIDNVPIFRELSLDEKMSIMDQSSHKKYKKNEIIFMPGDSLSNLYVVNKGLVKISRISDMGKEQIIRILQPGDFIGELTLFSNSVHKNTAEALENTEVCIIQGQKIKELLLQQPDMALKFLQKYTERIEESEKLIEQVTLRDVEQRIASYLLHEIEKNEIINKKGEYEINLPVSKGDLSSLIGTTQETLSRKLSLLQDSGVIRLEGQRKILVTDIYGLENLT